MAEWVSFKPVVTSREQLQRGNTRQACFVSDEDHGAYADWLEEYSKKCEVDIHAWIMMTNTVKVWGIMKYCFVW